jgi:hypothetical protein
MIINKEQAAASLQITFREQTYQGEIRMEVSAEVARNIARRLHRSNDTFFHYDMMESDAYCGTQEPEIDPYDADWWWIRAQHRTVAIDGAAYTDEGKFYIAAFMNYRQPDNLDGLDGTRSIINVRVPCDEDLLDAAVVLRDLLKLAALPPLMPLPMLDDELYELRLAREINSGKPAPVVK